MEKKNENTTGHRPPARMHIDNCTLKTIRDIHSFHYLVHIFMTLSLIFIAHHLHVTLLSQISGSDLEAILAARVMLRDSKMVNIQITHIVTV